MSSNHTTTTTDFIFKEDDVFKHLPRPFHFGNRRLKNFCKKPPSCAVESKKAYSYYLNSDGHLSRKAQRYYRQFETTLLSTDDTQVAAKEVSLKILAHFQRKLSPSVTHQQRLFECLKGYFVRQFESEDW